jgi:DNA-binding SARP family transcriptional activator
LTAKYFLRKDGMLADAWGVRIAVAAHDYKSAAAAPAELVDYFHTKFRPTTADMIIFYRALALYSLGDYTRAWRELLPEPFSHMYDPQRVALKMVLAQEMQLTSYEKIFFEQTTTIIADNDTPPLLQVILRQYLAYDLYLKALNAPAAIPAFGEQMQEMLNTAHIIEANDTPFALRVYIAAYRMFPELREQLYERFILTPTTVARGLRAAIPEASEEDKKLLSDLLTRLGIEEINTEMSTPLPDIQDNGDPNCVIRVTSLGGYSVELNGQAIEHKQWTTKNQELLLYFLVHHNEDVSDHDICRSLWQTKTIDSARNSLMNGVHTLKKIFTDILGDDDHGLSFVRNRALFAYKLNLGDSYSLDIEEFTKRCKEMRVNRDLPAQAAVAAKRALRLCKGDLVTNSALARATQILPWLETERKNIREQYFDLLAFFAEQKDPGLFPIQDVHDVLTTIFRFKEITPKGAEALAAFISRAAHFSTMRGEEAEAEKIQHAFRQMREMHPSLAPIE